MLPKTSTPGVPLGTLFDRRNRFRLPVCVPAVITAGTRRQTFAGSVVDISEDGIGFLLDENLLGLDDTIVSFWLPFDAARPNEAMLEPVSARLTVVSRRYHEDAEIYAYSAVFVGLNAACRKEIGVFLARERDDASAPVTS